MFMLYLSVFFALGLFVSSLTVRSSSSFLTLLFIWIVLVLIVPKVADVIAVWIQPAPFAHETLVQKTHAVSQIRQGTPGSPMNSLRSDPQMQNDGQKLQNEFDKITLELGQDYEAKITAAYIKIDHDHRMRQDAQQRLARNLSRVSPASGLTLGSMVLARTGVEEYNRFMDATRSYRAVYNDWLVQKYLRNPIGMLFSKYSLGRYKDLTVADMPQFQFEPESLGESLMRVLPDFALMAAMTIIFLAGAFLAFFRYDVR